MRAARLFVAILLAACLAACASTPEYTHDKGTANLDLDLKNCEWDATHVQNTDGSWSEVELSPEELQLYIDECMQQKGYSKTEESE
ncbi:hypothetical protein [Desulfobaculum bizertense]|uniref:Uncharacterized protein n=1 Tax=Desulfobaculum bizertense DSM 18034 TaxID=1121442 RepID=A0A1T4WH92_9BACT|nr:hypothetical protein [Desulfobaculum bizertense]UIJ39387.1 hypothetical protein LWC08_07440 [Desulfobaculum bizertense]SKA76539.1 hypothetical protein SAMN02745702_02255 [Desulfobaculum bizertense DSM 18034]